MAIFGNQPQEQKRNGFMDSFVGSVTAHNMKPSQVQAESGGQQFDKDGEPLVGRYKDGTTPPKGKQAFGVAQIQVGTAKATALKHGIPWDERKMMTDAAYNKRLGDLHMGDLKQYYGGDETLAIAAYHSGTGNVDKAVKKFGRSGFTQGLGAHGRDYVRKLTGEGGTGGTNADQIRIANMPGQPNLPANPIASQSELDAMGKRREYSVADPFAVNDTIGARTSEVDKRSQSADTFLQGAIDQLNVVQETRKQMLGDVVAEKQIINDQMAAGTQVLIEQAVPLFQKRVDIVNRRAELRKMNPFARLFKGLSDSRYNEVEMAEESQTNEEQIGVLNQNYEHLRKLQGDQLQNFNVIYNDNNSLLTLEEANIEQDLQLTGKSIASAQTLLNNSVAALNNQLGVDAAQDQIRSRIMSNLSEGQVNAAVEQAKANGGKAVINGVEIPESQLEELSINWENKRLGLEGMRMGYQLNQIEFAEKMEQRVIDAMSPAERAEALASGGTFQGQQLNLGKLASVVQNDTAVAQSQIQQSQLANAGNSVSAEVDGFKASMDRIMATSSSLFGSTPPVYSQFLNGYSAKLNQLTAQLEATTDPTQRNILKAQTAEFVSGMRVEQEKLASQMASDWSGGNKYLKPLAESFIMGKPLAPQQAVAGLLQIARGGLPAGMSADPASQKLMKQAQAMVQQWDATHKGEDKDDSGLMRNLQEMFSKQRDSNNLMTAFRAAPALALKAKHPFGRVTAESFAASSTAGAEIGNEAIADQLGISAAELTQMLNQGFAGGKNTMLAELSGKKIGGITLANDAKSLNLISQLRISAQMSGTLQALDSQGRTDTFVPSAAFANFVASAEYQKAATQIGGGQVNDFSGFILKAAGGQEFSMKLGNQVALIQKAAREGQVARIKQNVLKINDAQSNPMIRTRMALRAIDGITENEEKLLLGYFAKQIPDFNRTGHTPSGLIGSMTGDADSTNGTGSAMGAVSSIILGGKLADPTLESIRKKAAKDWVVVDRYLQKGLGAM